VTPSNVSPLIPAIKGFPYLPALDSKLKVDNTFKVSTPQPCHPKKKKALRHSDKDLNNFYWSWMMMHQKRKLAPFGV
jgi:hypothetical protein